MKYLLLQPKCYKDNIEYEQNSEQLLVVAELEIKKSRGLMPYTYRYSIKRLVATATGLF